MNNDDRPKLAVRPLGGLTGSEFQKLARMVERLPVGANAPEPLNHVPEHMLVEVAQVLTQITRHPRQAVSKGELLQIAEKGVAQVYIYERRLKVMRQLLEGFKLQVEKLPEDDPLYIAFRTMYNSFDKTLKGEHK